MSLLDDIGNAFQSAEQGVGNFFQNQIAQPVEQAVGNVAQSGGQAIQGVEQGAGSLLNHFLQNPQVQQLGQSFHQGVNALGNQALPIPFLSPAIKHPTISQAANFVGSLVPHDVITPPAGPGMKPLTPQQLQGNRNVAMNIATSMSPVGETEPEINKAVQLLRNKITPEDVDFLGKIAAHIEDNGPQAALGDAGKTYQALAENVFGKDAANWDTQKIKNSFDLVLGKIGEGPNKAGLGLGTNDIRAGKSTENPPEQTPTFIQDLENARAKENQAKLNTTPEQVGINENPDLGGKYPPSTEPPFQNPKNTAPVTLNLQDAAKNALIDSFAVKQNIEQAGANALGYVQKGVNGPEETALFRNVIEHPETMQDALTKVKNPDAFQKAADVFGKFTDYVHTAYNGAVSKDDKIGYIKDFYSHIVDLSKPEDAAKFDNYVGAQISSNPGWFSKTRIYKDVQDLNAAGFKLKNSTVPEDIQAYTNATANAASKKGFINSIQSQGFGREISDFGKSGMIPRDQEGANFVALHPGSTTFVSPNLYQHVKNTFGKSDLADNPLVKGFDTANRITKTIQLGLSGFHAAKTTVRELVNNPLIIPRALVNAVSPAARLAYHQKALEDGTVDFASKIGVTLGRSGQDVLKPGQSTLSQVFSHNPISAANRSLFDGLIDTYKIDLVRQIKNKFDLGDANQLKQASDFGAQINNLMGGLNYAVMGRNKTFQQVLRSVLLAPDFNEGKLRATATAANLTNWSPAAIFARKNVVGEALVVATVAELGRKLTTGKFDTNFKDLVTNSVLNPSIPLPTQFNNPKSGKKQVAGIPGSNIADAVKAVIDPQNFIASRGSAAINLGQRVLTGKDYYGNALVNPNSPNQGPLAEATAIGKSFLPIGAAQVEKLAEGKQTVPTTIANIIGARVHTDPNDPGTVFFNVQKADLQKAGFDANQINTYNSIHPQKKDADGNVIYQPGDWQKASTALAYLNDSSNKLLNLDTQIAKDVAAKTGQPTDPFWNLPTNQQLIIEALRIKGPSGESTNYQTQLATQNKPWLTPFYQAQANYFQQLQSSGQMQPPTGPQPPQMSPALQAWWNQHSQLPTARAKALDYQTPMGQQASAFMQQQAQYQNQQLVSRGLPASSVNQYGALGSSTGSSYASRGPRIYKGEISIKKPKTLRIGKLTAPLSKVAKIKAPKIAQRTKAKIKIAKTAPLVTPSFLASPLAQGFAGFRKTPPVLAKLPVVKQPTTKINLGGKAARAFHRAAFG